MESPKSFLGVVHTEKQLMTVIYSKGMLHRDFLKLYREIRTGYEKILLNNDQMMELQEVEYHLWKLHYKLIDEFRKRTWPSNTGKEEGFLSFLHEATEFYCQLIVKIRKMNGLPAEIFLKSKRDGSLIIEGAKLHACQYTCHRLLICLGDIARYIEVVKKPNACDWSTAAKYYMEATKTWPDSGNPHNQLALLATYVGDPFLALYHCVRSLAVKEPFPDAWRNLKLVLEENRSTQFQLLSSEMQLDFSNPSKRIALQSTSPEENDSSNRDELEEIVNVFDVWPVLVRTLDFLLTRSSLEEFPSAFATALHKLEALLTLDDTKLIATLESYKYMDSSRKGPYHSLQLVSIFIFIVHCLTENPKIEDSTEKDDHRPSSTPLAFAAVFICMGRLTERCMRGNPSDVCPLLPTLMVFSEWLVGTLDAAEVYDTDEKVVNAKSYFMNALVDLMDRVEQKVSGIESESSAALWEDHELMGFYPLAHLHETLDFTTHLECMGDFRSGNELRVQRIFHASMKIIQKLNKVGREFNSLKSEKFLEPDELAHTSMRKEEKTIVDEEEVILFKPITRRNSAPLYISSDKNDLIRPESTEAEEMLHNNILRRAASLSIGRATETDSFSFCTTTSESGRNRSSPPSLSAWVVDQEIVREKGPNSFNKQNLSPIDELASTFFCNESKDFEHISTVSDNSTPNVTTIPSAPSLPKDAVWLSENLSIIPDYKSGTSNEADGILGAASISPYPNRSTFLPPFGNSGLVDGYPPFIGMSSSEWLYHYRNTQNVANNPSNRISPIHFNDHAFGKYNEVTFDLCDRWGNRVVSNPMMYIGRPQMYPNSSFVYGGEEQIISMDKLFLDYQRPFPYVCGVGMDISSEQLPPLQYLKDKEWQMQAGPQLRSPTFMRN